MKVYITIVDTNSGQYQFGMIDEPVKAGQEVPNALAHFGIRYGDVNWESKSRNFGNVDGTTKVVSVICTGQMQFRLKLIKLFNFEKCGFILKFNVKSRQFYF